MFRYVQSSPRLTLVKVDLTELFTLGLIIIALVALALKTRSAMRALPRSPRSHMAIVALTALVAGGAAGLWYEIGRADTPFDSRWALPDSDFPTKSGYALYIQGDVPVAGTQMTLLLRRSSQSLHRLAGQGWDGGAELARWLPGGRTGDGAAFAYTVSVYPSAADTRAAFADLDPRFGWMPGPGNGVDGLSSRVTRPAVDHGTYGVVNAMRRGRIMIEQACYVDDLSLRPALATTVLTYCARQRADLMQKLLTTS